MLRNIVDIIVVILGVHTLLKFAFFFVLPYDRRRTALDRAYEIIQFVVNCIQYQTPEYWKLMTINIVVKDEQSDFIGD